MSTLTPLGQRLSNWLPSDIEKWARARRERILPDRPPSAFAVAIAHVPEGAWWLLALAAFAACVMLSAIG